MSAHDICSGRQNLPSGMHLKRWRMTHGPREARVRSIHGFRSTTRFRRVREATRWRPSPTRLLVSRPVSLLGVRTADLSRKPARHRDVSAGPRAQALPCGLPRQGLAEHIDSLLQLHAEGFVGVELEQTVYALDSTTIDLCLSLFPWARFRRHKAAVKMHTLLDLHGSIPTFIRITEGKT